MIEYLQALPHWLGGKRQIAGEIVGVMREEGVGPGSILLDPFMGGGSISMVAKALGYEVHANDVSPIAEATGHALIQNSTRKLSKPLRDMALTGAYGEAKIPGPKELSVQKNVRLMLSRMVAAERACEDTELRFIYRAWIIKTAMSFARWGKPSTTAGIRSWDEMTPGQMKQLANTGKPLQKAMKCADLINGAIFDNAYENTMSRGDAIEFIKDFQSDGTAHVLYADPPYPGAMSYEHTYRGLSRTLEPDIDTSPSAWSKKDGWRLLADVMDAAADVSLWVVSMGDKADPEAIAEMMSERKREPELRTPAHRHLNLKKYDRPVDELLLVGRRKK